MIRKKITMHSKVSNILMELVHEENLPVNIETGPKHIDCNGDKQIDVLLEYEEKDADCVNEALTRAVNEAANLITAESF